MRKLSVDKTLDATNMRCPMPLLKTKMVLKSLEPGTILLVLATDSGAKRDIPKYIGSSLHTLVAENVDQSVYQFYIKVGNVA